MYRVVAVGVLLLALLINVESPGLAVNRRMPHGSFLTRPVVSVRDLANEVRRDPVVRKRLSRQWGIPPDQVASYIERNFVATRLKKPGVYPVWAVYPNGLPHVKNRRIPAGTRVFANRRGMPLMLTACGNPMVSRLPQERFAAGVARKPVAAVPTLPPPIVVAPPPPIAALPPPVAAVPPAPPVPPEVAQLPPQQPEVPPHRRRIGILPFLLVGGGIALGGGGGGGGGETPPIPDASSLALMATGMPFAWWMARRQRK